MNDQLMRLDKFLSNHGVASRRAIKKLFKEEEVLVNGMRVMEAGYRVDPEKDDIRVNGKKMETPRLIYFLLNKPKGYLSTTADEMNRKNVLDLVPSSKRIYPIGRLDKDTTGLLLLTNDGELTHKLTHPRYHIDKTYRLIISGTVSEEQLDTLRTGVLLDDGVTLPAKVKRVCEKNHLSVLELTIFEGRNRQIRRMCETLDLKLLELQRIKFGPIGIGDLKEGKYRVLTEKEIAKLRSTVNHPRKDGATPSLKTEEGSE